MEVTMESEQVWQVEVKGETEQRKAEYAFPPR